MKPPLAEGKLAPELLERLLRYTSRSASLAVGASPGEDAAVAAGAPTIVLTADPITFTDERIGAYTVAVNANDIVAMGGRPVYLTTTILLPPGTREEEVERIFADIAAACRKADLLWVGGHTEVTSVVTRTVVAGQAVGFLSGPPLSTGGARPGDALCMTKWVGLEGTTTIARERPREAEKCLGTEAFQAVRGWLDDPGISIVEEGRVLAGLSLSSGHDPTEGGVAMGIHEMCARSGTGAIVRADALPIRDETRRLCGLYGMNPMGILSSGVFLFTARPAVADEACALLAARGIPAAVIGEIREPGEGILIQEGAGRRPLAFSVQDEIVKLRNPSSRASSARASPR